MTHYIVPWRKNTKRKTARSYSSSSLNYSFKSKARLTVKTPWKIIPITSKTTLEPEGSIPWNIYGTATNI